MRKVASMEPVVALTGKEFPQVEKAVELVRVVYEHFGNRRNIVHNPILGDIAVTRKGIASDVSHGYGPAKISSFAAVPDVIGKGEIVDFQYNWDGKQQDRVIVAAPIQIAGEEYLSGVVVVKTMGADRYYLHEVAVIKNNGTEPPYKTGVAPESGLPSKDSAPLIVSILQKVLNYKTGIREAERDDTPVSQAITSARTSLNQVSERNRGAGGAGKCYITGGKKRSGGLRVIKKRLQSNLCRCRSCKQIRKAVRMTYGCHSSAPRKQGFPCGQK